MATRASMKTVIGRRTGMSDSANLDSVCSAAFDFFLAESCLNHTYQEMRQQVTIDIVEDDRVSVMPTQSEDDNFEGEVLHIEGVYLLKDSSAMYSFWLKTPQWLNKHFADRFRSSSNNSRPTYGCRINDNFHWQAMSNGIYTMYLDTTHLPSDSYFSDSISSDPSGTSTTNLISKLTQSLIAYGCHEVYEDLGNERQSERYRQIAYRLQTEAENSDDKVPGRIMGIEDGMRTGGHPNPSYMYYDEENIGVNPTPPNFA